MPIRCATEADIPEILALGAAMHAEAPEFRDRPFDRAKVAALVRTLMDMDDGLVLVADSVDGIVGGVLAMVADSWCCADREAHEFAVFVDPIARGRLTGPRLLKAYREWALSRGTAVVHAGITTGVSPEDSARIYASVGFRPAGSLFNSTRNT